MKKLSRMESSKEVRRVLNRNGVNLTLMQYSCAGKEIRMTGRLVGYDNSEYSAHEVEKLMADFRTYLPGHNIIGELENWSINSDHATFKGGGKKGAALPELDDLEFDIG